MAVVDRTHCRHVVAEALWSMRDYQTVCSNSACLSRSSVYLHLLLSTLSFYESIEIDAGRF